MVHHERAAITPIPNDDEAAAIIAALATYLAAQRRAAAAPQRTVSRWALAGRLASQGIAARRIPGGRVTWAKVGRAVG